MPPGALSLLLAVAAGYISGFIVTLAWTRRLHRRHGISEPQAALMPASFGGALGGLSVMAIYTIDRQDLLGL